MFDQVKVQNVLLMVFGFVVIAAAIALAAGAKKNQYHETARVGFNIVVSMIIAAIGLGAVGFAAFGRQILTAFGVTTGS